jgi:hypothetical protein
MIRNLTPDKEKRYRTIEKLLDTREKGKIAEKFPDLVYIQITTDSSGKMIKFSKIEDMRTYIGYNKTDYDFDQEGRIISISSGYMRSEMQYPDGRMKMKCHYLYGGFPASEAEIDYDLSVDQDYRVISWEYQGTVTTDQISEKGLEKVIEKVSGKSE